MFGPEAISIAVSALYAEQFKRRQDFGLAIARAKAEAAKSGNSTSSGFAFVSAGICAREIEDSSQRA